MKKLNISKEILINLYKNKKLTTFQIANNLHCCQATVWKRLRKFKIKPRLPGVKRVNIQKRTLKKFYIDKGLSTWEIERKLGIPRSTLYRKLKELKMIRDRALAVTKKNIADRNKRFGDINMVLEG